jgi:hypothetical protein
MKEIALRIIDFVYSIPILDRFLSFRSWRRRGWASPSPGKVKWQVLERYGIPSAIWVETGTYKGDTTAWLAPRFRHVYSIEPSQQLANKAKQRFQNIANVIIINEKSEIAFPILLPTLSGDISFYLDGHYSAGITFQGPIDTPILAELQSIELHLARWNRVAILVDDVRCFDPSNPEYSHYPSRSYLTQFAERNSLEWTIEHDIFCAWR